MTDSSRPPGGGRRSLPDSLADGLRLGGISDEKADRDAAHLLGWLGMEGYAVIDLNVQVTDDLTAALRDWLAYTRAPSGAFGQSMENTMAYESTRRLRAAAAKHLAAQSGDTTGDE